MDVLPITKEFGKLSAKVRELEGKKLLLGVGRSREPQKCLALHKYWEESVNIKSKARAVARYSQALLKIANRPSLVRLIRMIECTLGFRYNFKVSFSQAAEDIVLAGLLAGRSPGTYIDVGANHPVEGSVTYLLYQCGWRGVLVDGNSDFTLLYQQIRPQDISLTAVVGEQSSYKFFVFDEPLVSGSDPERIKAEMDFGRLVKKSVDVSGLTIRSILDTHFAEKSVTLLSIDTEGMELEVLRSINFDTLDIGRYPEYILVETLVPAVEALNSEPIVFLRGKGYVPLYVLPQGTILKISYLK